MKKKIRRDVVLVDIWFQFSTRYWWYCINDTFGFWKASLLKETLEPSLDRLFDLCVGLQQSSSLQSLKLHHLTEIHGIRRVFSFFIRISSNRSSIGCWRNENPYRDQFSLIKRFISSFHCKDSQKICPNSIKKNQYFSLASSDFEREKKCFDLKSRESKSWPN